MTTPPRRNYTRLAIAIVAASLIIGSITYLAIGPANETVTITSTASCDSSSILHCVVFQQLGACSNPEFWGEPWSVTIGNQTIAEPSTATLPVQGTAGASNPNDTITFSVPNGTYSYTLGPGVYFEPSSGVVHVNGSDVKVVVAGPITSCTEAITTSSQ